MCGTCAPFQKNSRMWPLSNVTSCLPKSSLEWNTRYQTPLSLQPINNPQNLKNKGPLQLFFIKSRVHFIRLSQNPESTLFDPNVLLSQPYVNFASLWEFSSGWWLLVAQVLAPSIPTVRKLKSGRYSDARQRLYPGCLLIKVVMNREVYNVIRSNPRIYDFFGTKAQGTRYRKLSNHAVSCSFFCLLNWLSDVDKSVFRSGHQFIHYLLSVLQRE